MSLNVPDFLGPPPGSNQNHKSNSSSSQNPYKESSPASSGFPNYQVPFGSRDGLRPEFDDLLRSKLSTLENDLGSPQSRPYTGLPLSTGNNNIGNMSGGNGGVFSQHNAPPYGGFGAYNHQQFDAFNLPTELQGGIGTISSRRPSFAAESFTRSHSANVNNAGNSGSGVGGGIGSGVGVGGANNSSLSKGSLATFAAANNYSMNASRQGVFGYDQLADLFQNFSLNANLSDFQARRPLQLADHPLVPLHAYNALPQFNHYTYPQQLQNYSQPQLFLTPPRNGPLEFSNPVNNVSPLSKAAAGPPVLPFNSQNMSLGQTMKLDNGLLLKDQYIMASADLKIMYSSVLRYFQDTSVSKEIMEKLQRLLENEVVVKLITFIKNLNNLTFNHKMLCLVINKNGKLDLLSYPSNSNIFLQEEDLVIVDGDRGKDLVMILAPLVSLNMAILFNFLKKIEHLKSLTITDNSGGTSVKNNHCGGTHSTSLKASSIINNHSNEDNEFIITLPTKQVLRFATPKEVLKLSGKFLEEKKAFITCFNKIKELGLNNDLTLINVEYQCDFKKLIFYYFANFKRIDFRGLIKELFKIYKTRIWLCAVLPYDRPDLYTSNGIESPKTTARGEIPREYDLSNEQIMNFSVAEFENLSLPSYFHLKNMLNLIDYLGVEVKGNFYGFNVENDGKARSFDPFDDERRKH